MLAKRIFDVLVTLAALPIVAPISLLIALLVRLSSPGPALFRQTRVGLGGKSFSILKFRTMFQKAGSERGTFDAGDSSRVTRIGKILRATKLDELPQLWNVLAGEMSLVGPRPEIPKWVQVDPERWSIVHSIRPGITDPAAIVYRHEERILAEASDPEVAYRDEILPAKLRLYVEYVSTRSFWGDLRILWRTLVCVFLPPPKAMAEPATSRFRASENSQSALVEPGSNPSP